MNVRHLFPSSRGRVYLVGAGPGDPELITLKAVRLLQRADVVVYDNLVSEELLQHARSDAQLIYAGKRRSEHTMRQEHINALLVQKAREGKQVVRLKGGDPFVFGRGGEEMQELALHGVDFEVVPGITAACGVASYAGIPLTHRDHAQGVLFVTGHLRDGSLGDLDWESLVRPRQTVVIYMGLHALLDICSKLIAHGAPTTRPIAAVQHGTLSTQKVISGTLGNMPEQLKGVELLSPSLVIVGDVVKLHDCLHWFVPDIEHDGQRARSDHSALAALGEL